MAIEDMVIGRIISGLLPSTSGTVDAPTLSRQFLELLKRDFGMDEAELVGLSASRKAGAAEEYVINTRKPYVDNQLSEYSAFPSLIDYRNKGYRSCALLPVMANGKVALILRMLSSEENKFGDQMIASVAVVTAFFSSAYMYKAEASKNARLAEYFDASFESSVPQMLVVRDGSVIRANRAAMKAFYQSGKWPPRIEDLFGMGFQELRKPELERGRPTYVRNSGAHNIYLVSSKRINDNLFHVSAVNMTGKAVIDTLVDAVSGSGDLYLAFTDRDFSIISVSPNLEKLLKYSNIMSHGKRFTDIIKEADAKSLQAKLGDGSRPVTVPVSLMTGDSNMPVRAIVAGIAFGYLIAMVSAEAESYVKEAKENMSSFIESTSDIAIKLDTFGYIRECNLPVEQVLGYAKDELIGRELRPLYRDAAVFDRDIAYVRNGGKIDNSYVDLIKRDNDVVSGMQSMRLMRGSKDEEGYLVIVKELETKRRLSDLEASLRERENELRKISSVSDQKSEFIYDITHELKTPLTNIKGFSSLLYEGQAGELSGSQKEYVDTIIQEADRLVLIIQQVLDAAKLEANKVKLDLKEVDLKAMGNNPTIRSLGESARRKGLEFQWNADYDIPEISADPNRLLQVFVNLIGNAIKFTESGSITIRIFRKSRAYLECDVVDTGIGIAEEDQKKLFKKFYQAPKKELARQDGAGTGLGLSITREIVKLHGGKISFESQQGKGSRFWFTLPMNKRQKRRQ